MKSHVAKLFYQLSPFKQGMDHKTFVIPKDKEEKANINGALTDNTDYIIMALNEIIDEYIEYKKKLSVE